MRDEMPTHPNKVQNDGSAFCCAVSEVRPETGCIRGAEEEEPDAQGQLWVELARLVGYELAGDSTEKGEEGG